MFKATSLALVSIVVTLAGLVSFSLATVKGRSLTLCKVFEALQGKLARTSADREVLGRVLPRSGTAGASDTDPPERAMQWLTVRPELALPLPEGAWKLRRKAPGTVSVENEGDELLMIGTSPESADQAFSALGRAALGRELTFGEMVNRAYATDLAAPCDPRQDARTLFLETSLMSIKGVADPGRIEGGVRDQLPYGTTIVRILPDGAKRMIEAEFQDPGDPRRWLHLTYLLNRSETARDVVRAIRLAARSSAARGGSEYSPDGWPEALSDAGLAPLSGATVDGSRL